MGQWRGRRGPSSVLGKGFVDGYSFKHPKVDRRELKVAKWGTKGSRRVPKGAKGAPGGSQCSRIRPLHSFKAPKAPTDDCCTVVGRANLGFPLDRAAKPPAQTFKWIYT